MNAPRAALLALSGSAVLLAGTVGGALAAAGTSSPGRSCRPAPTPIRPLPCPTRRLSAGRTWLVALHVKIGAAKVETVEIRLAVRRAPVTAASFAYLVGRRFYDYLTFWRIAEGFVIQGGDPVGDGTGGPGYQVVEPPPASLRYTVGTVAMAKAQSEPSGASGSQFFIVTGPYGLQLPPQYALVGSVVRGLDVVERIGRDFPPPAKGTTSGATYDGPPRTAPVLIESATLSSR